MNESRQRRRARQRGEQKATTRPGPRGDQPPRTAKRAHVIVASLHRNVDDSEPEPGEPAEWVDWSCEYELRGESVGIDDSGNPDLHDVVNGVLDYARQWVSGRRPASAAVGRCGLARPTQSRAPWCPRNGVEGTRLSAMTSEYALGFSSFVARYRYPGQGIALGRDAQGVGFAAYWLTGRSPESRGRQLIVDSDALEINDIARSQSDPLRHYTAILRGADRIVVGNGTQVGEVAHDLDAGVGPFEALAKLEYEPDPPIRTPRITATARVAGGEVSQVILSGAVAHPRWPETSQHNMFHTPTLEVGQCHAMTTYGGDTATVSTSGQPTAVDVDVEWAGLLEQVWDNLDPALRVAVAVVPLVGDLRQGRFVGAHQPLIHAGTGRATT